MVLLLVFMQLTRDLFAIAKFLLSIVTMRFVVVLINEHDDDDDDDDDDDNVKARFAGLRLWRLVICFQASFMNINNHSLTYLLTYLYILYCRLDGLLRRSCRDTRVMHASNVTTQASGADLMKSRFFWVFLSVSVRRRYIPMRRVTGRTTMLVTEVKHYSDFHQRRYFTCGIIINMLRPRQGGRE